MKRLALCLTLASLLLAGCARPPHQAYEGAPRPADEVATIKVAGDRSFGRIFMIDHKTLPHGTRQVAVLPGSHRLWLEFAYCGRRFLGCQTFSKRTFLIHAEAGHNYRIIGETYYYSTFRADYEKGARLRGVDLTTRAAVQPGSPPRR